MPNNEIKNKDPESPRGSDIQQRGAPPMMEQLEYLKYVHKTSNGRWVVARYDAAKRVYIAPGSDREARRVGGKIKPVKSPDDLEGIGYAIRASALRRAKREYAGGAKSTLRRAKK